MHEIHSGAAWSREIDPCSPVTCLADPPPKRRSVIQVLLPSDVTTITANDVGPMVRPLLFSTSGASEIVLVGCWPCWEPASFCWGLQGSTDTVTVYNSCHFVYLARRVCFWLLTATGGLPCL